MCRQRRIKLIGSFGLKGGRGVRKRGVRKRGVGKREGGRGEKDKGDGEKKKKMAGRETERRKMEEIVGEEGGKVCNERRKEKIANSELRQRKTKKHRGPRSQRGQNTTTTTTRDKMAGDRGAAALTRGYLSHPIAPSSAGGKEEPRGKEREK